MLVDPIFSIEPGSRLQTILEAIAKGLPMPRRVCQGTYLINGFSFGEYLKNLAYFPNDKHIEEAYWLEYPILGNPNEFGELVFGEYPCYGVCDSIEQFFEHAIGKWITDSERKFAISFTRIQKEDAGGWRWHKWGEYIGIHQPKFEYLHDEDDSIKEVYCFGVYECLNEKAILKIEGFHGDGELMSVFEYLDLVRTGDLTHNDGYGYSVINSVVQPEKIYPAMCPNTGAVSLPPGVTHVVWCNI